MNDTLTYYLIPHSNAPDIQLNPGSIYCVGRSPENNILLADPMVSRKHARIEFAEGSFFIEDTGSTNGTKINGENITRTPLKTMDEISFGKVTFTFKVKELTGSGERTLTPEATVSLEKDLDEIIQKIEKTQIRNQLISFKKKLNSRKKQLVELAYGDALTGLYNRRYFDKVLSSEIRRSIRYKRVLSMIMVDIDHFKKFNDTYGHQKGDSVLRTVGTILKENSRSSDIVCRYGGEEIAVILPEQTIKQGIETAEKLREILASEAKEIEGVEITASFGVSSTGGDQCSEKELISRCDQALYLAKKSGRNCTKSIEKTV